jgi:hypothetical protein
MVNGCLASCMTAARMAVSLAVLVLRCYEWV